MRPSVAHQGFTQMPDNPDVSSRSLFGARQKLTFSSRRLDVHGLLHLEPESLCFAYSNRMETLPSASRLGEGRLHRRT